jgi:hypothetical protein
MFKQSLSIVLASIVGLTSISAIAPEPAQSYPIKIFSRSNNRHGRIIRTSVGIFYIGKSGDAMLNSSGYKSYGYWVQSGPYLTVYIDDDVYSFTL